jgi:hypothetical protein
LGLPNGAFSGGVERFSIVIGLGLFLHSVGMLPTAQGYERSRRGASPSSTGRIPGKVTDTLRARTRSTLEYFSK